MNQTVEIFLSEREKLYERFADRLETSYNFSRKVVSFQANKDQPAYRWFKYKEGFSSNLVKYLLREYSSKPGKILDPFAGVGTTLFAAQDIGWESFGIEVLPVGIFTIQVREAIKNIDIEKLKKIINNIEAELSKVEPQEELLKHISITKYAFPEETEILINKFLSYCNLVDDISIGVVLKFALFSILEEISYTRKDGQYLRWDYRSKRELLGKPFDKGRIFSFEEALKTKFYQIITDLTQDESTTLFEEPENDGCQKHTIKIVEGSSLEELPKFEDNFFDFIITSPPYCNRYDYTRTYALELVYLGYNNEEVRNLRQAMLSCTVENKEKIESLNELYSSLGEEKIFNNVLKVYNESLAMTEVNSVLEMLNKNDRLNNNNIPRMVKNYFFEMCFVIYEMVRITKQNGYCIMVNDNVRYGGEEIPVDLILSEFAENFGFRINKIFVLPKGKGNSSQQMGNYGRTEVRKCVYLWQKK